MPTPGKGSDRGVLWQVTRVYMLGEYKSNPANPKQPAIEPRLLRTTLELGPAGSKSRPMENDNDVQGADAIPPWQNWLRRTLEVRVSSSQSRTIGRTTSVEARLIG